MAAPSLKDRAYPHTFYIPAAIVYVVLFIVPTAMAFFFSLTRWTLFDWEFIGLDNFVLFFNRPALVSSMRNTLIYAVVTSGLKVVIGLLLAVLFTSQDPAQDGDALDGVLPGARQHRRRGHHLQES